MKVKVNGERKDFQTVSFDEKCNVVKIIDQTKLPHSFEIISLKDYRECKNAIKNMQVRGAPAIGVIAAYSLTQETVNFSERENLDDFISHIDFVAKTLKETRPTAFDLFYAVDFMLKKIKKSESISEAKEIALKSSKDYTKDSVEKCRLIGVFGEKLIKDGNRILTHCNAGALACVDYGTALAPIRFAHENNKDIFVFVDETRPRLQGSLLTAWELYNEDIPHAIIVDNAAGYFMRKKEIDLVIVGADRIAGNGDFANKIGTYEKAVVARENNIPFYVAAPLTTFDKDSKSGDDIKIEERKEEEVLFCGGTVQISNVGSSAKNPSFDVTPSKYVKGFITEKGIINPDEIEK